MSSPRPDFSRARPAFFAVGLAAALAACGGSETHAKSPTIEDEEPSQRPIRNPAAVEAEIGALDEGKVDEVFSSSVKALERCLHDGARRVEFMGGGVSFYVKVDTSGSASHAHLEQSTLGDRDTEKCMLSALRSKSWPKPVGGEAGYARKSFDFDPPNDVRPPTEWPSDRAGEAVGELSKKLDECKNGVGGKFTATLYVATDGSVLAAGVTPPDETGESSVDCLVGVLKEAKLPSPGSWPAKISFEL
jgi:hypothetical protein